MIRPGLLINGAMNLGLWITNGGGVDGSGGEGGGVSHLDRL
jgi:hypothetical protein